MASLQDSMLFVYPTLQAIEALAHLLQLFLMLRLALRALGTAHLLHYLPHLVHYFLHLLLLDRVHRLAHHLVHFLYQAGHHPHIVLHARSHHLVVLTRTAMHLSQ
ncbi:MAG: hypothetical protein JRI50_07220 [Deltaproteobacteria bacterium]|nr:hypothetical protein [Deltaproteobacteria bacterium]MBW1987001.1 hypothetical protein [Deltaproteobacteria bacterium]MBW2134042.1 hypothetical protein [Deltaproteobacteria bacterium]